MKSRYIAAIVVVGAAFAPAFAQAAESCLGSETITEFKQLTDGTVLLSNEGKDFRLKLDPSPRNVVLAKRIKTRSTGDCLSKGDEVVLSGQSVFSKYKIVSIEPAANESSTAASNQ